MQMPPEGQERGGHLPKSHSSPLTWCSDLLPKVVIGIPVPRFPTSVSVHGAICHAQHNGSLHTAGTPHTHIRTLLCTVSRCSPDLQAPGSVSFCRKQAALGSRPAPAG